jgi:hypothetical protein
MMPIRLLSVSAELFHALPTLFYPLLDLKQKFGENSTTDQNTLVHDHLITVRQYV